MTLSLNASSLKATSSWEHTFPANGCAIAVACFKGPTSFLMATTHQVTGVTYGNVALTLRCDPLQVSSHVCVWELSDLAAIQGRDDDIIRVTGGSFGSGSNLYSARSFIVVNTEGSVTVSDFDEFDDLVGNGANASVTVDPGANDGIALIALSTNAVASSDEVDDLSGQSRIADDDHASGQVWICSSEVLTSSQAVGYTNNSGGNATFALGVVVFSEVPAAIVTMERSEVTWTVREGFQPIIDGPQLVYMERSRVTWQTRDGFEPVAGTGQRQVPIIGGTIETAEMTTGGTEGQVLTQHTDRPPSWEDPSGENSLLIDLSVSGSVDVDRDDAATHDLTLTGNATLTPIHSDPPTGEAIDLRIIIRQDAGGGNTLDWGGTIAWAGGSEPTMPTGANELLTVGLLSVDDGTTWLGYAVQDGAVVASLDDLTDVTLTSETEGDMLRYESGQWVNTSGRYEPVVEGGEIVFDDGDIVMTWIGD